MGDDVDPDLDFITDDDDLAVLFSGADGKPFWGFGNVEEVAVVRGDVDKSRALGGNSAKYLLDLDKDPRPLKGRLCERSQGVTESPYTVSPGPLILFFICDVNVMTCFVSRLTS